MTAKYPGWRTMTAAQRHNAKAEAIFADAQPGGRLDAGWDTGDPLPESEQTRRGQMLARVLRLQPDREWVGTMYTTEWGTKTALGLYRTVKRIIEEGK